MQETNFTNKLLFLGILITTILLVACDVTIEKPSGSTFYEDQEVQFSVEYNGVGEVLWKSEYIDEDGNTYTINDSGFENGTTAVGKGYPWEFKKANLPVGLHTITVYKDEDFANIAITILPYCDNPELDCSSLSDQCNVGTCDSTSKTCLQEPVEAGTSCDDENDCTAGDACTSGVCSGETYSCNEYGTCNSGDDVCSCDIGYAGDYCNKCANGYFGYPDCVELEIVGVESGQYHTCAILEDGTVQCWGDNSNGQLGDGTTVDSATPVAVSGLGSGVVAVSAGYDHTCALLDDGSVKCWGKNDKGQLGDGTSTNSSIPVNVSGLENAIAVSAGNFHTCAVLEDGVVKCWGLNNSGQLGDGTTAQSLTPVTVSDLESRAISVVTGMMHSCTLLDNGAVKCWGVNYNGQLGDGTKTNSSTPVAVTDLDSGVKAISGKSNYNCALLDTGIVKCWGMNNAGQIGNDTTDNQYSPVAVSDIDGGAEAIMAGHTHTCALFGDDSLECWGSNSYGQLGDGTKERKLTPIEITALNSTIATISNGGSHTCALLDDGNLKCWGSNNKGQLGTGNSDSQLVPAPALWLEDNVGMMSTSYGHSCAILDTGALKCWGRNYRGQLGDGTNENKANPVDVTGLDSGVIAVATGKEHSCAVTNTGAVKCWGYNSNGQLGDGTVEDSTVPVVVSGLDSGAVAISAGKYHTCAVLDSGIVKCWGYNYYGQLGDTTAEDKLLPTTVSGMDNDVVIAISSEYRHTCALLETGAVKCWGYNTEGQLGDGTEENRSTPVQVSGLESGVTSISAGEYHTCALLETGVIKCWGYNDEGGLGDGTDESKYVPTDVIGLGSGAVSVSAGGYHTCATLDTGAVKCWGDNEEGELGDGTYDNSLTPINVSGLDVGATSVEAGEYSSCAIVSGTLMCWGYNSDSQLTGTYSLTPVDVAW